MPEVQVTGDGAGSVRFSDWSHVRVHGQVVRWEAQLHRLTPEPIGDIQYTLFGKDGEEIGTDRPRYNSDVEPGSSVQATFLAFGGGMLGDNVRRIRIEIDAPPRPVRRVRGPPRLDAPSIRP